MGRRPPSAAGPDLAPTAPDDRPSAGGSRVARARLGGGAPIPVLLLAALLGGWVSARTAPRTTAPGTGDARRAARALSRPGATAVVERTIDGDTASLRYRDADGAGRVTVRYLGVDTPETVHPDKPVQCYGPAASHANHRWATGKRVRLRFDRERVDPYDRLLAALVPAGGRRSLSERLVAAGYARVLTIAPNGATAPRLEALQRAARRAHVGLWGACADALASGR